MSGDELGQARRRSGERWRTLLWVLAALVMMYVITSLGGT